ncbi:MAG: tetratricopeptide repeat protein [Bacteroidetes bacterium]|nr:tetratricopeptide repeat protein [Bacteroidota bacterium]
MFLYMLLAILFSGCAGRSFQSSFQGLKYDIVGEHMLMLGSYKDGISFFEKAVIEHPESAEAAYYMGRFLLAVKKPGKAVVYLKKASGRSPGEADYHFWLGVSYGEVKKTRSEKESYEKALQEDKKHLQAMIYLGNNQLRSKKYQNALGLYQRALKIWPQSPSALYNRALASKYMNRTPEAKTGWLEYLRYYPSGGLARRAVIHLNQLGDFSFRTHRLGARTISLPKISFEPLRPELTKKSMQSLRMVGATGANFKNGTLQVVVYQKNNHALAKQRALRIKKYLQGKFPELRGEKIKLSWFAVPEKVKIKNKTYKVEETVQFLLTYP